MNECERLSPEDICAHYGEDYASHFGAMSPPIYQTSLFIEGEGHPYSYSRAGNPTLEVFERKVAAMEKGDLALVFASGMAAISTAILSRTRSGSHMVMIQTAYGPARGFASYIERFGISVTFVRGSVADFEAAIRPETSLFYLESPSSGIFELQDLPAVTALAKKHSIATIIDNTYATPMYQQPLNLGVDLVVHSASKYLGGHSDVVAGVVVGRGDIMKEIFHLRTMYGNPAPPLQAWLLQRGIRTLAVRMPVHMQSALTVARFLESHPAVEKVYHPGLPSHPQYDLYLKQMSGTGGQLSFKPRGTYEQRRAFMKKLRVFQIGPSWGGYDSLAYDLGALNPPNDYSITSFDGGVIRLYIGLESVETLVEDLAQALAAIE